MMGEEKSRVTEWLWGKRRGKNESVDGKNWREQRKVGKKQTSQSEAEEEEKRNRCWKRQSEESQHADSQTETREMDQQTGNEERERRKYNAVEVDG